MTTQIIQCFEVLCETRNFTKAAERLYISQSSLSKQLKNLETELDCQLIDRTQTPIAPTPAGVRFQEYCHRVNRLHRDLIADLRPYQRCPERVLRIASIPLMVDYGAVRCITSFQAANPALKIEFSEGSQLAAQQALEDHTADVAIIRTETLDLSLYDSILISEDQLVCVCNSASPFAQRSTIHLQELQDTPFISYDSSSALHAYLIQTCQQAGFTPNIIQTGSRVSVVFGALSENASGAVALLPAELVLNFRGRFPITSIPLAEPLITHTAFVKPKTSGGNHSTLSTFWNHVHQDFD